MASIKNPLGHIKLVYRRSSTLLKVTVLVSLVLALAALLTIGAAYRNANQRLEDLRGEAADLIQENQDLQDKIDKAGSVDGVEQVAQDELGLVDPDTVILNPDE